MSITDRISKLKNFIAGREEYDHYDDSYKSEFYHKQPFDYNKSPLNPLSGSIEFHEEPEEESDEIAPADSCPACVAHASTLSRLSRLSDAHSGSSEAVRGHIDAARTLLNNAHDMHVDDEHGGDNTRKASVEPTPVYASTASSRIASLRSQLNR